MTSNTVRNYKFYTLLSCEYVAILFVGFIIINRVVHIGPYPVLSGTFTLPICYALMDVITEVYGYKMARQLIWVSLIVLITATILITVVMQFPLSPQDKIFGYRGIFAPLPRNIFAYTVSALVGTFVNAYCLSKCKILLKGRFLWLRSLGATLFGETFHLIIMSTIAFSSVFTLKTIIEVGVLAFIIKAIFNVIFIVPIVLLSNFLKKHEQIDKYDYDTNFNPFKFFEQESS